MSLNLQGKPDRQRPSSCHEQKSVTRRAAKKNLARRRKGAKKKKGKKES
jgi:hypothetical protein